MVLRHMSTTKHIRWCLQHLQHFADLLFRMLIKSLQQVWRNVLDYGATGNGQTDDTAAINAAIEDGNRCGLAQNCNTTSAYQAVIYFPSGTYLVSASLTQYYFTQFIGNVCPTPKRLRPRALLSQPPFDRVLIATGVATKPTNNQG
jgi:hypothetical protein